MKTFSADELLALTGGTWAGEALKDAVSYLTHDTRNLEKGMGFVALNKAAHCYLHKALDRGASIAIVENLDTSVRLPQLVVPNSLAAWQALAAESRQSFQGPVISITGSHGKTSTKDLLRQLLGGSQTHANERNQNGQLGVPLTLMRLDNDQHKQAVIEAGISMPGEMVCLEAMIKPDMGCVTLIGQSHIEHLKSIENIAFEKSQLFNNFSEANLLLLHISCMDFDSFKNITGDIWVVGEVSDSRLDAHQQVIRYSIEKSNGYQQWLRIQQGDSEFNVYAIPPMTDGMICNTVCAISLAQASGIKHELIQERLRDWYPSDLRGEVKKYRNQYFYVDCYGSSSPASLNDSLAFFKHHFDPSYDRLYIIGAMAELGEANDQIHFDFGKQFKLRSQDRIVIIGQAAHSMRAGLYEAGNTIDQILYFETTQEAMPIVRNFIGAVYLKGGHALKLHQLVPQEVESIPIREVLSC